MPKELNPQIDSQVQKREELRFARKLVREGRLSADILERRYSSFVSKAVETPQEISEELPSKEDEKPTIEFVDGEGKIQFLGKEIKLPDRQFRILGTLARHVDEEVLVRDLSEEAFGNPNPSKTFTADHFRALRKKINRMFDKDFLTSASTKPGNSWYKLSGVEVVWQTEDVIEPEPVDVYPSIDIETREKGKTKEEEPTGTLLGLTKLEQRIYEELGRGSEAEPLPSTQVINIYGDEVPRKTALKRLSVALVSMRKKLQPNGIRIVNSSSHRKEAHYYIEIEGADLEPEPSIGLEEETEEEAGELGEFEALDDLVTAVQPRTEPEIEIVPYEASEEEKRSKEETKILRVVTAALLTRPKMRYEEIQSALFDKGNVSRFRRLPNGKIQWKRYLPLELKEKFLLAFKKIREEAEIPLIRNLWKDEDELLWQSVQTLHRQWSGDDTADFIRKIKIETERSYRGFIREYPTKGDPNDPWMDVPKEKLNG